MSGFFTSCILIHSFTGALGTHSKVFTGAIVLVGTYFLMLLIACVTFSVVVQIIDAISPISRGLATARPAQNAGFASCQVIIPPADITPANPFASGAFRLAPAICPCRFFPVYCSIILIISCRAGKLSRRTQFSFVIAVCACALSLRERVFVISRISLVNFSNLSVICAYSGTACTILSFTALDAIVERRSHLELSGVPRK